MLGNCMVQNNTIKRKNLTNSCGPMDNGKLSGYLILSDHGEWTIDNGILVK